MPDRTSGDPTVDEHVAVLGPERGGVSLVHRLAGPVDGPRVLSVSGSGTDLRHDPSSLAGPLVERCRVLAYDHRGLGRSTTGPGAPTMEDFAEDLLALLDHVGWDTCRAIGISFGGMVLMDAATRAPSRFERLVLACTSAGGEGGASFPLHTLVDLSPAERRERRLDILDVRNADDPERRALVLSVLEAMDEARGGGDPTPGEVAQLLARADHDCFDRLPALTMPVLLAAGRFDGIAPPANQQAMASVLPDATVEWFRGGHAFFLEDRTAWPTMVDFLTA